MIYLDKYVNACAQTRGALGGKADTKYFDILLTADGPTENINIQHMAEEQTKYIDTFLKTEKQKWPTNVIK